MTAVFWPFEPLAGFGDQEETREWGTDIIPTKEREFRINFRETFRLSVLYKFMFTETARDQFVLAKLISENSVGGSFKIPYWQDYLYLGAVTSGSSTLLLDTTLIDLFTGQEIVLWQSYDFYEILTVGSFDATSVVFTTAILNTYSKVYIIPVITGICPNGISFVRGKNNKITASVQIIASNYYSAPDTTDITFFQGTPVLPFRLTQGDTKLVYTVTGDTNDSFGGNIEKVNYENFSRISSSLQFSYKTKPLIRWLRGKLDVLLGAYTSFWLTPGWDDVLPLDTTISAGDPYPYISVKTFGGTTYPTKFCRILGENNTVVYAEIYDITTETDHEVIFFIPLTPTDLVGVWKIEFMYSFRFATDTITLKSFKNLAVTSEIPIVTANPIVSIFNPNCFYLHFCGNIVWGDETFSWGISYSLTFWFLDSDYFFSGPPSQRPADITLFIIKIFISVNEPTTLTITRGTILSRKIPLKKGGHEYTIYAQPNVPLVSYSHDAFDFTITQFIGDTEIILTDPTILHSIVAL